jgi:hypothetical protein
MDDNLSLNPTRSYQVLLEDETEGVLVVTLTDEGIIADLVDSDGEVVATFSNMADEFIDFLR